MEKANLEEISVFTTSNTLAILIKKTLQIPDDNYVPRNGRYGIYAVVRGIPRVEFETFLEESAEEILSLFSRDRSPNGPHRIEVYHSDRGCEHLIYQKNGSLESLQNPDDIMAYFRTRE